MKQQESSEKKWSKLDCVALILVVGIVIHVCLDAVASEVIVLSAVALYQREFGLKTKEKRVSGQVVIFFILLFMLYHHLGSQFVEIEWIEKAIVKPFLAMLIKSFFKRDRRKKLAF